VTLLAYVCYWGKTGQHLLAMSLSQFDPDPTSGELKSRSAAVSCRTEVCYPFGRKHGKHRAVKRRDFISLVGGAATAGPAAAAQLMETPDSATLIATVAPSRAERAQQARREARETLARSRGEQFRDAEEPLDVPEGRSRGRQAPLAPRVQHQRQHQSLIPRSRPGPTNARPFLTPFVRCASCAKP